MAWATSGIFITWIVDWGSITPVNLAFWRDLVTFSCLLIVIILFKPELIKVERRDLLWLMAMGVLSVAGLHVLWNATVLLNGAALATVIQANAPIFVALIAWGFWREPLTKRKIIAWICNACLATIPNRSPSARNSYPTGLVKFCGSGIYS